MPWQQAWGPRSPSKRTSHKLWTWWQSLLSMNCTVCDVDGAQTRCFLKFWNRHKPSTASKTRPGADCGSDHELLIAKFRLKLKKVEKTTRPFRYDLDQIPYDYIVQVINRFKGLDLMGWVPEELWMEFRNTIQKVVIKTIPRKRNSRRQNGCPRRPFKYWEKKRSKR